MLAPLPVAISVGSSAWVTLTRPVMLVSIMVCQSARSTCCAGCGASARPALLTRQSIWRNSAGSCATTSCTAPAWRTSSVAICTGTFADSSPFSSSRRSLRRPVSTSAQPASAKRRAVARPKPEVAPVMNTIFCFMLFLFL